MIKKTLLTFFLFLSCQSLWAGIYYGAGFGYTRYSSDRLQIYDQVSSGPRFGLNFGYNLTPAPLAGELFYNYASTKTSELNYHGAQYIFHAKFQTLGMVGKYFIGMFHLRLGYAVHFFNTSVTYFLSGQPNTDSEIATELGSVGKKTYHGPLFGGGFDVPIGSVTPYIVATSYQLNSSNSDIFELEGGLKFSF